MGEDWDWANLINPEWWKSFIEDRWENIQIGGIHGILTCLVGVCLILPFIAGFQKFDVRFMLPVFPGDWKKKLKAITNLVVGSVAAAVIIFALVWNINAYLASAATIPMIYNNRDICRNDKQNNDWMSFEHTDYKGPYLPFTGASKSPNFDSRMNEWAKAGWAVLAFVIIVMLAQIISAILLLTPLSKAGPLAIILRIIYTLVNKTMIINCYLASMIGVIAFSMAEVIGAQC